MWLKNLPSILSVFLLIPFLSQGQTLQGLPFSRYYSSLDYEGGIQNWSITQNKEGLLYVANNFGLLEYDGTFWKRYTIPNQTKVRDVFIANDSKVVVAGQGDFGYFQYIPEGMRYVSLADSLPDQFRDFDETWRVFQNKNKLIFCTFDYFFVFDNYKFSSAYPYPSQPENFHFINNTLFVSLEDEGLMYFDNDTLKSFPGGNRFSGQDISVILPLANNHLLIGTSNNGIYTYNGKDYNLWNPKDNEIFKSSGIRTALRLKNGNVAIGTQNEGLLITDIEGKILQRLNKGRGLNNRTALALYQDILGNLWVGHNNGITMLELSLPFSLINEQVGLSGTGYDGIFYNDKVYLATNNGVYTNSVGTDDKSFTLIPNSEGQAYHFNVIDNQLFIGHHRGSFKLESNKATQFAKTPGTWTYFKLKKHPDYMISGNYNGLAIYKKVDNNFQFIRKIKGFNESSRVMKEDDSGNVWMTHGYKGVYKLSFLPSLDSVSVSYYGTDKGFPSKNLINVWQINDQLLFTTESGIYQYNKKEDKFEPNKAFEGILASDIIVSDFKEDGLGNIYYISTDEIGKLEKLPNNLYQKSYNIFNRLKGLLNDDLQNLSVINNENVLYGAKEGFIVYNPYLQPITNLGYKTLIRSIKITSPRDSIIMAGNYLRHQTTMDDPENAIPKFPYQHNSLQFIYSAPFFQSTKNTTYQYKLEGLEDNWSSWVAKTDKEYTTLSEGTYTFKVRAKNIYEEVGETASYTFTILPPWYRSTWAYLLYVSLVSGTLGLSFFYIKSEHDKEKTLLHMKQKKEINRIDSELRSSEEKLEHLRAEKLKVEVENKDKQLATSTMHLVNKNSFINSVKQDVSNILKRSKNQEIKKELNRIVNNINKNITEDDDWDHFAIHFDQVHGDFTKRIKEKHPELTPQEMKLSAYLRMNLSTKEIAHLLNISVRGVEIARYRLRKKLNLQRSDNLQDYILNY